VSSRPKNWDAFFAAAPLDPLLPEGASVVRELSTSCDVVWLTGRPEHCRDATVAWLRSHGLPGTRVLMRRGRDFRPSATVKVERLRDLARERPVSVLVDDDVTVCAAAEAAGFAVFRATWMPTAASLSEAQNRDGRT
jgi:hypothetical protein